MLIVFVVLGFALFREVSNIIAQNATTSQKKQPKISQEVKSLKEYQLAIDAIGKLAVKNAADGRSYDRSKFGEGWAQVQGCDVRNLILRQSLKNVRLYEDGCLVLSGVLEEDPYTGKRIEFTRGQDTSDDIQIDHIVALSNSWVTGAQQMTGTERIQFANDPLNLLAVDGPANQEKSNSDASEWLPRKEFRCRYIARQIAVKLKYDLWITQPEQSAMNRTLNSCPEQPLPLTDSL